MYSQFKIQHGRAAAGEGPHSKKPVLPSAQSQPPSQQPNPIRLLSTATPSHTTVPFSSILHPLTTKPLTRNIRLWGLTIKDKSCSDHKSRWYKTKGDDSQDKKPRVAFDSAPERPIQNLLSKCLKLSPSHSLGSSLLLMCTPVGMGVRQQVQVQKSLPLTYEHYWLWPGLALAIRDFWGVSLWICCRCCL